MVTKSRETQFDLLRGVVDKSWEAQFDLICKIDDISRLPVISAGLWIKCQYGFYVRDNAWFANQDGCNYDMTDGENEATTTRNPDGESYQVDDYAAKFLCAARLKEQIVVVYKEHLCPKLI